MENEGILKIKFSVFFAGCTMKSSGVVGVNFKLYPSNLDNLTKILGLQKSEVELYTRIGATPPAKLGRFIFDRCVCKNGESQLSFSSVRESVEMSRLVALPLPREDAPEFDLLCKIFICEGEN